MTRFSSVNLDLPAHFHEMNGPHAELELRRIVGTVLKQKEVSAGQMWALQRFWTHAEYRPRLKKHKFASLGDLLTAYNFAGASPRYSFEMVERAHWLVSPARMQDLDIGTLCEFRFCVENGLTGLNSERLRHLPAEKISMIMDLLTRKPIKGKKGGQTADLDQLAMMVHVRRTGGSHDVVKGIFKHPMPDSIMPAVSRTLYGFYETPSVKNGWTWETQQRHPRFEEKLQENKCRRKTFIIRPPGLH